MSTVVHHRHPCCCPCRRRPQRRPLHRHPRCRPCRRRPLARCSKRRDASTPPPPPPPPPPSSPPPPPPPKMLTDYGLHTPVWASRSVQYAIVEYAIVAVNSVSCFGVFFAFFVYSIFSYIGESPCSHLLYYSFFLCVYPHVDNIQNRKSWSFDSIPAGSSSRRCYEAVPLR